LHISIQKEVEKQGSMSKQLPTNKTDNYV